MMYYSFGTSKTGPNNFILSYLCGRTIDAILLEILLQYIPGIDSLKRIIMQIFHRNVPDVNLSHLEIAWTFGIPFISNSYYRRCKNMKKGKLVLITRATESAKASKFWYFELVVMLN